MVKSIRTLGRRGYRRIRNPTLDGLGWPRRKIKALNFRLRKRDPQVEKRLLAIWDFRALPFTFGDQIIYQAYTLIERIRRGVDKIDILCLVDSAQPVRSDQVGITPDNFHFYLADLLPLIHVNQHLGSYFVMDSHQDAEAFIRANRHRYHIYPPLDDFLALKPTYKGQFDAIQDFYRNHGYIPHLSCKPGMLTWARSFIKQHVRPLLPVTVHLRNNKVKDWHEALERNSPLDSWLDFFRHCQDRFEVKFIVACGREEIDLRFRELPNVILSKDHATTIEQDLALVQSSMMFMGGRSGGVSAMAVFTSVPYLKFDPKPANPTVPVGQNPAFANPLQKWVWEAESTEALVREFTALFSQIDTDEWERGFDELARDSTAILQRSKS